MATGKTYLIKGRFKGDNSEPHQLASRLSQGNYFYPLGIGDPITFKDVYEKTLIDLIQNVDKLINDEVRTKDNIRLNNQSIDNLNKQVIPLKPLVGYLDDLKRITDLDIVNENDAGFWETFKVP